MAAGEQRLITWYADRHQLHTFVFWAGVRSGTTPMGWEGDWELLWGYLSTQPGNEGGGDQLASISFVGTYKHSLLVARHGTHNQPV
jgi:hypothetical protein